MVTMKRMKSRVEAFTSSTALRLIAGFIVSALAIYLASRDASFHEVWSVLSSAHIGYVGLALASVAINTLSKALRWKLLIGTDGRHIGFSNVTITLLIGQMLNTLIPLRLGDVTRAWVIGGMGPGRAFVFGTIVIEKFLDMVAYATLFLVMLLLIPLPNWINQPVSALITVAIVAVACITLLIIYREQCVKLLERLIGWLPVQRRTWLMHHLRAALSSVAILQNSADRLRLVLLTVGIWVTAILNNYLALVALDLHHHVPPVAALLLLIVLQAGLSIPSIPGNIGVFEYGCMLALEVFGIGRTTGLSYGILLHAIVLLPTTLLGLFFFWVLGLSLQRIRQER